MIENLVIEYNYPIIKGTYSFKGIDYITQISLQTAHAVQKFGHEKLIIDAIKKEIDLDKI